MKPTAAIAAAFLALAALTPRAADAQSSDNPFLLGSDESGDAYSAATRGLERPQDAPGFLVVVYERDITERGYRTLADLLADVPGFWLEKDERGDVVFTRGLAQSILVVYDGVPLIFDTGRSDLPVGEEISLVGVRSVEVLRGPGTALWGPNAFNGIVYIRTKDAVDVGAARLLADVGSTERAGLAGELAYLPDKFSLYATARFLRERGPLLKYENTPIRYNFLGGLNVPIFGVDGTGDLDPSLYAEALMKVRWKQARLEIRYADSIKNSALSEHSHMLLESGRNLRQRAPTLLIQGGNRWAWQDLLTARTDLFMLVRQRNDRFPLFTQDPAAPHRHGGLIRVRGGEVHLGVSAQGDLRLDPHTVTAGVQASLNDSELVTDFIDPETGTLSQGAVAQELTNSVVSVYAQDRLALGRTRVTVGASVDGQTDFALSVNPRAGVVVQLGQGWISKALYAEGIRTPDLFDVVGISGGAASGDVVGVSPNPDLKSEKIRTAELGAEYRRGTVAWASAALYASSVERLIEQEASAGVVRADNTSRRYAGGVELAATAQPLQQLRFHGSYTLSRLYRPDGTSIGGAPMHFGSLGISYDALDWLTLYAATRGATERPLDGGNFGNGYFGPYLIVDTRVSIRPREWPVRFSVGVDNLLDADYDHRNPAISGRNPAVPIPGDPRAFYLTVEGRF